MNQVIHLNITKGPDQGRAISIPSEGGRIGRSRENDIHLSDDSLSRFHCRVFFRANELFIADLGSTNQTLVNGNAVSEQHLSTGDVIEIGETELTVVHASLDGDDEVDLGFQSPPGSSSTTGRGISSRLLGAALTALLVCLAGAAAVLLTREKPQTSSSADLPANLFVRYEKVEADASNIFRYALTLDNGRLSARVDDLANDRHLAREEDLSESLSRSLAESIRTSGFFQLEPLYEGLARDSHFRLDLEIGLGSNIHRTQVLNRMEPDHFRSVRLMIEEFADNELGLAALAMPPEELIRLAEEATQLGARLLDQRAIAAGNLYRSVLSFREAIWYLETIEPKPDFYPRAVAGEQEASRMLDEWIAGYEFQAERAIKLNDWASAAEELRQVIEQLPDPDDPRYQKAQRKLLDVERRINR